MKSNACENRAAWQPRDTERCSSQLPPPCQQTRCLFWKATSKPQRVFSSHSLTCTLKPWAMLGFDSTQRTHPSQDVLASWRIFKASWEKGCHHPPLAEAFEHREPNTTAHGKLYPEHLSRAMLKKQTNKQKIPPHKWKHLLSHTASLLGLYCRHTHGVSCPADGLHRWGNKHSKRCTYSPHPGRAAPCTPSLFPLSFQSLGMGSQYYFFLYFFIWRLISKLLKK